MFLTVNLSVQHISDTKYLHKIEYRVVSGVFQTTKLLTPFPLSSLHPASVSSPVPKARGLTVLHTRLAVRGWWVNILEDDRHWIGLLQYIVIPLRYRISLSSYYRQNLSNAFQTPIGTLFLMMMCLQLKYSICLYYIQFY